MLALQLLDVLSPLKGMLRAKLGLLPLLAITCPLDAPLMEAQVGGLLPLPTPPTAADRPRSNANRQPLKQARLSLFVRQVG